MAAFNIEIVYIFLDNVHHKLLKITNLPLFWDRTILHVLHDQWDDVKGPNKQEMTEHRFQATSSRSTNDILTNKIASRVKSKY